MIKTPAKVPQKTISSLDFSKFSAGLFTGNPQNAPVNSFIDSRNIELDINGYIEPRRRLVPFLPDTIQTSYQKSPVLWNNKIYYFTGDNGKIRFCLETDLDWTDCGGTNSFTTTGPSSCKFLRVLDNVLILNGKNGDKIAYVDLSTAGFPIVKYTAVANPTGTLSPTLTGITGSGSYKIYYAYSYTSTTGETELSAILSQPISSPRDLWQTLGTPGTIKLTRSDFGSEPAGSKYWNLYIALAASGGVIQKSDMLQLAIKLDLSVGSFLDDGTLAINLDTPAPLVNSSGGFKASNGIVEDGNPILFDDPDNPENIYIAGGGVYAMDFSINNGGYTAQPEKGTNFHPTAIIGFRNGQGTPSLTILFSNTEGLSKQSVLEQKNVTYGGTSFSVWGVTSQHYGAAGVAAENSPVNYNGRLLFLSTDGFMSMNTQPLRQNVIATDNISIKSIDSYVRTIKNSATSTVVGCGWDNKFMWTVPAYGFDTPQQILVYDTNNVAAEQLDAWYTLDIPANWIGVVSPATDPAFVYVSVGKSTYKLFDGSSTSDVVGGVNVPFATEATGALTAISGSAHNTWQASVQAVFYILDLVGTITVGINYRNLNGKLKTKKKVFVGPAYTPSHAGGWGDPGWVYAHAPLVAGWGHAPLVGLDVATITASDVRIPVRIDDIASEVQWFFSTEKGYNNFKFRAVSFEGISLGVRPDLQ